MTTLIGTDTILELSIPGGMFRDVDPQAFDFPKVTAELRESAFGPAFAITAEVPGIQGPVDLLFTPDADAADVHRAADRFNEDPTTNWQMLLNGFFRDQRASNAERRAALEGDEAALLDLEAGFLR